MGHPADPPLAQVESLRRPADRLRMAGTFNGWSPADDAYELKPVGDQFERVGYWRCGTYEFKFVFNGAWDRHLGAAGEGRLVQPGDNIKLAVGQSGTYAVRLDPESKTWTFEPRPATEPHAVIVRRYVNPWNFVLDGSLSQTDPRGPTPAFQWSVRPAPNSFPPGEAILKSDADPDLRRTKLELHKAGRFQIDLIVTQGSRGDRATLVCDLGYERIDRLPPSAGGAANQPGFAVFEFDADDHLSLPERIAIEHVDVVGDFNNWRPGANPLWATEHPRIFKRAVALPDGVHHYKYLVNGVFWLDDPNADPALREPDGTGGYNSGVRIGPDPSEIGPAMPDNINCAGIRHVRSQADYYQPISDDLARVGLRALAGDVQSARIVLDDNDRKIELWNTDSDDGFDLWTANCSAAGGALQYTFDLRDGAARTRVDSTKCHPLPPDQTDDLRKEIKPFKATPDMKFKTPDWAKRAVWYQIFPERFANGDPANDPPRTVPWTHPWHAPYDGSGAHEAERRFKEEGDFFSYIYDRRYGGDLQGVRAKLPYLRRLGVTAIYFNPIFQAASLHKYDASDYRHVDDAFGVAGSLARISGETADPKTWQWSDSDRVFLDFLREAHRQGFKVIIDGVFNHVGREFWAFQDVLKHGRKSRYAGWFDVTSWNPFHYKAWDRDDGSLPRLKHDDALGLARPVREHLFAVTRRWMDPDGDGNPSDGVDGWRLDVASDINANFWKDWRRLVKSINPDAYVVAELWEESRAWLDGRTFDAVMNYPFARACQKFFVNRRKAITPTQFDRQLREILGWYPPQVNYVLQNLMDSHDTDRLASMFMNPDVEYDKANRVQDNGPRYDESRPTPDCYRRLKSLVTCQMMALGAPMVYYGDEVGMFGADDPSCRKPMLWKELMPYEDPNDVIHDDVFDHYRRMIAIRNTYPPVQLGTFDTLLADDAKRVFAFARRLDNHAVVVVINNSDKPRRVECPAPLPDGATIVRLDDPKQCEVADPPDDDPASRPAVRPVNGFTPTATMKSGRLTGVALEPRSAAVFTDVAIAH